MFDPGFDLGLVSEFIFGSVYNKKSLVDKPQISYPKDQWQTVAMTRWFGAK